MLESIFSDFEATYLDLPKIVAAEDLPDCIRKLASDMIRYQYVSSGDYFASLDDVEVFELANAVENINSKNLRQFTITSEQAQKDLYNISLLSILLACGEGESELKPERIPDYMAALFALIMVESLYRNGSINAYREHYSVIDGTKVIASKK